MISPADGGETWDKIYLAKTLSPGVVRLSGPGLVIGWDIQSASGTSGGVTTRINAPIKEFDAEFYLTDEEDILGRSDFDEWDSFQKLLESSVAKKTRLTTILGVGTWAAQALDVVHPDLARVQITAVTLKSIGMFVSDNKGGGKIVVKFLEYKPPKRFVSKQTRTAGDDALDASVKNLKSALADNKLALAGG